MVLYSENRRKDQDRNRGGSVSKATLPGLFSSGGPPGLHGCSSGFTLGHTRQMQPSGPMRKVTRCTHCSAHEDLLPPRRRQACHLSSSSASSGKGKLVLVSKTSCRTGFDRVPLLRTTALVPDLLVNIPESTQASRVHPGVSSLGKKYRTTNFPRKSFRRMTRFRPWRDGKLRGPSPALRLNSVPSPSRAMLAPGPNFPTDTLANPSRRNVFHAMKANRSLPPGADSPDPQPQRILPGLDRLVRPIPGIVP